MGFHSFFLSAILMPCISFVISSTHQSQNFTKSSNDLKALTGFSSCLDSAILDWNISTSPDYCTWSGVTCGALPSVGTRVVQLELGSTGLGGKICEYLAGLDQLRVLNLSHNFFSGFLPDNLFHLQNLEVIDLSNNYFNGSINTAMCTSFTRVQILKLSNNFFSGKIPGNLGNCYSLQHLSINGNDLSGSLPESIFQLQKLSELYMQDNKLSGPLSKRVGNLLNLVELDISNNQFYGTLPNVFGSLTRLKVFSADSNRLTGQLPASLVNSPSLQMLNMNNNSLGGSINLNCSTMKNLTVIALGSNQFHCPIPSSLTNCLRLEAIDLSRNQFNCGSPFNFKNLQSLTQLFLSNANLHNLSATLEVLSQCRNISTLVLTNNFHSEDMPQIQNLEFKSVKFLSLASSKIKGSIPEWLSGCKMLQMLDLSWNHLSGSIPSWIGKFNNLYYLDLSNNSFTGNIPQSLTWILCLQHKNSSLQGTLSAFPLYTIGTGTLKKIKYQKVSSFRPSLLLSYNKLEGQIWPSFGNLKGLHVMDLKHNSLSGSIPSQLSGMAMLEILDLSHNKLSGEIPESLIELSFLSAFDVSYNQLHGEIPTKGQFDTFPSTSFEGNKGLLYHHGTAGVKPSLPDEIHSQPHHQKLQIIGFPFWFGAIAGFVIIIAMSFASGWMFIGQE
ncbi:phytosulfokine receptor 1-like [Abrus precatorius]|uniref:Phytosulfokine receptor 1-like n=1 Tax=Abrus precatorius TaxID=3816 RepID=A0A8B8L4Y4_ABRPR|nr:phytosulfokine receptor 1-like [Abrus precatorius]